MTAFQIPFLTQRSKRRQRLLQRPYSAGRSLQGAGFGDPKHGVDKLVVIARDSPELPRSRSLTRTHW